MILTALCLLFIGTALHTREIPIEVPAIFAADHEKLTTTEIGSYQTLEPFEDLIQAQHKRGQAYLLARVVTQDAASKFYIHYFDAHDFFQYLNIFTTEERDLEGHFAGGRKASPPELTGRNTLLYNPFRENRFFEDSLNHLPITLVVQYFELAPDSPKFTHLCSHEDLFIERTDAKYRDFWRNYIRANKAIDMSELEAQRAQLQRIEKARVSEKELAAARKQFKALEATLQGEQLSQQEALNYLKKNPRRPQVAYENPFSRQARTAIRIHLPSELGAPEFLDPQSEEPLTQQTFQEHLKEQVQNNDLYLIVRVVTQDAAGNYSVSYGDAHAFNTLYFQDLTITRRDQETAHALLYHKGLLSLSNPPLAKNFYENLQKTGILNRNILYFSYDPHMPEVGFTFLCSHYDLFITDPETQTYWRTFFKAHQHSDPKLKEYAAQTLKTELKNKETSVKKRMDAQRKKIQEALVKERREQKEREEKRAPQVSEGALELLAAEGFFTRPQLTQSTMQALTKFNQELAALTNILRR